MTCASQSPPAIPVGGSRRGLWALAFVAAAALSLAPAASHACPFCNAAMQTLSEEIAAAETAVVAELEHPAAAAATGGLGAVDSAAATAKFRVLAVLRGGEKLGDAKEIEVVYFGNDSAGKKFLITALRVGDRVDWSTPVPLSDRGADYVQRLPAAPKVGADRLAFFQEYLENADPLLAQDAYDEFSRRPYADLVALGPQIKRDRLLQWIGDSSVGPTGRRLYLTMLGVCGQAGDVAILEELLSYDYQLMKPGIAATISTCGLIGSSICVGPLDEMLHGEQRRKTESLDALIACYLKLKGPAGLPLINQRFLSSPTVEFKQMHAALMALRFHGEETNILPREKLLESMRLALGHKEFADQVIPDLTRWEDWSVMPRLVKMFKDAPSSDWIRQAVVSYLLVAADQPGDVGARATQDITELQQLDPDAVKSARDNAAFAFLPQSAGAASTPPNRVPAVGAGPTAGGGPALASGEGMSTPSPAQPSGVAFATASVPGRTADSISTGMAAASANPTEDSVPPAARQGPRQPFPPAAVPVPPNRLKIIGVPLLAVLALLAILAVLLRGADPRSSDENP